MTKLGGEVGEFELTDNKRREEQPEEEKRNFSCLENLQNYIVEYCSGGTIHGIRYFVERRTCIEKFWWICSVLVSLYFCVYLINATYTKWDTSPVIVSFATKETPIWQIPFPAVTICPQTKSKPSLFNYTKYLNMKQNNVSLDPEIEKKLGYLSFICNASPDLTWSAEKFADKDIFDFYTQTQTDFHKEIASDCKYMGVHLNCSEAFVPVITDEGVCFTFNLVDRSKIFTDIVHHHKLFHSTPTTNDWKLEHGYSPEAQVDAYPRRALFPGLPNALEVNLALDEDDMDYNCGSSTLGFKVQISHPERMPRVKEQHFVIPSDAAAMAAMAPDIITTSQAVQNYDVARRNCHFPSERGLRYFKVYSQNNCEIECATNFTLSQCGCVNFYMPREKDTPICGAGSYKCMNDAAKKSGIKTVKAKIAKLNGQEPDTAIHDCKCFPNCYSMKYFVENSQANWDWRNQYRYSHGKEHRDGDNKKKHMTKLQVFFKAHDFINQERNELYGLTDFVANVGGLLGLFVGFSALSLIEIIYFLTLRIVCNIGMYGAKNWSGKSRKTN